MDARRFMIIDTSETVKSKMYITQKVCSIKLAKGMWHIVFDKSPTVYTYRRERIEFLKNTEKVDITDRGFYLRGKHIENIQELYRFNGDARHFYHVVYGKGNETDYDEKEVYVSRTTLSECGGSVWKYLCQLASEVGMEIADVGNILKMQYDIIDEKRDNVPLAQFVGDKQRLSAYRKPSSIIYPFGCNASQKKGVENALTHQVSIIQGPPGTGKTQTILNIIANLLIQGKSVLVVSNNNSAIENVAEKLNKEDIGLGFLVAELGRKENKEMFVANQPKQPDMTRWVLSNIHDVKKELGDILRVVTQGFEKQTKLSQLRVELEALRTEKRYNELLSENTLKDYGWLSEKPSKRLLEFKLHSERLLEQDKHPNIFFKLKWAWRLGWNTMTLLSMPFAKIVETVDTAFYVARMAEINKDIAECEDFLENINIDSSTQRLRKLSLMLLKDAIAKQRTGHQRSLFSVTDIKPRTDEFMKEYPIVLSTTYSSKNCIGKDYVFDYLIMDEASQVDITTGALALSCANNAVIVGDDKQLPNVVDERTRSALTTIEELYHVEDKYRLTTHSFLQSCCKVFRDAPQTLLREHYRCHPKIIEFCNQMFYDGQLVTMTKDNGEPDVIKIIRTGKGNYVRDHYNQREIDVVGKELKPLLDSDSSIGIITPYRNQADEINRQLNTDKASTVHKYQGRECDCIIMSMVDCDVKDFSDDPNLMNVAISRAKNKLIVVTSENAIDENSHIGQLIAYAKYNNFEVVDSKLRSVFDLLYKPYAEERLAFEASLMKKEGSLAEMIILETLKECIADMQMKNVAILPYYPLSLLIADNTLLSDEEKAFAHNPLSHVDFLIYNTLTKQPLLCIEVDGWAYHKKEVQQKRDHLKDCILEKYGLKPLRISTVETVTKENLIEGIRLKMEEARKV